MLRIENVSAGYTPKQNIIEDISLECPKSSITAVIGQNGSGKSTLLKAIARQISLSKGNIFVEDKDIFSFSPKELAQRIAVLPQVRNVPSIPAKALVMHGRFPYLSFPRIPSLKDKEIVKECMRYTDTLCFENKDVATLSGGQRQRVYIAMLLAQETDIVLLDEPTTFLDINSQMELTELIKTLKEKGKSILVVLHDITEALQIADKILLMDEGKGVFYGTADELVNGDALQRYMNIIPHKIIDDKKTVYYFSQNKKQ